MSPRSLRYNLNISTHSGERDRQQQRNRSGGEYRQAKRDGDWKQSERLRAGAERTRLTFTGHQYRRGGDDHATRHRQPPSIWIILNVRTHTAPAIF